jgi:hypothetical protein
MPPPTSGPRRDFPRSEVLGLSPLRPVLAPAAGGPSISTSRLKLRKVRMTTVMARNAGALDRLGDGHRRGG